MRLFYIVALILAATFPTLVATQEMVRTTRKGMENEEDYFFSGRGATTDVDGG